MLAYTVSKTQRDIGRKLRIFLKSTDHYYFAPPLRVQPSNFVTALWLNCTKIMELPGREKVKCLMIFSAISIQCTSVTDRRTDRHRTTAGTVLCIASRRRAVKRYTAWVAVLCFCYFCLNFHLNYTYCAERRICVGDSGVFA